MSAPGADVEILVRTRDEYSAGLGVANARLGALAASGRLLATGIALFGNEGAVRMVLMAQNVVAVTRQFVALERAIQRTNAAAAATPTAVGRSQGAAAAAAAGGGRGATAGAAAGAAAGGAARGGAGFVAALGGPVGVGIVAAGVVTALALAIAQNNKKNSGPRYVTVYNTTNVDARGTATEHRALADLVARQAGQAIEQSTSFPDG